VLLVAIHCRDFWLRADVCVVGVDRTQARPLRQTLTIEMSFYPLLTRARHALLNHAITTQKYNVVRSIQPHKQRWRDMERQRERAQKKEYEGSTGNRPPTVEPLLTRARHAPYAA